MFSRNQQILPSHVAVDSTEDFLCAGKGSFSRAVCSGDTWVPWDTTLRRWCGLLYPLSDSSVWKRKVYRTSGTTRGFQNTFAFIPRPL